MKRKSTRWSDLVSADAVVGLSCLFPWYRYHPNSPVLLDLLPYFGTHRCSDCQRQWRFDWDPAIRTFPIAIKKCDCGPCGPADLANALHLPLLYILPQKKQPTLFLFSYEIFHTKISCIERLFVV